MDLSGNAGLLFRDRQDEKTLVLQRGTGVISSCSIDETRLTIGRNVSTNDGRPMIGLCRSSASCASPSRHAVSSHYAVFASLRKRLIGLRLLNLRVPRPPCGYHIAPCRGSRKRRLRLPFGSKWRHNCIEELDLKGPVSARPPAEQAYAEQCLAF